MKALGKARLWPWYVFWGISLLIGLAICLVYCRLPVDGASGDMESFTPEGFHEQWLIEKRPGGLRAGDIVLRAGGRSLEEWLSGAPRGPEWEHGGSVEYEILRDGSVLSLQVRMAPAPLGAVIARWWLQLLSSAGLLLISGYVFSKRPDEPAARLMVLFCTLVAIQTWADAYNFQYAILTRRPIFWFHFALENGTFILIYGSILHFTLIFPRPHPLMHRRPRLTILAVYLLHPLVIAAVMMLSPSWTQALRAGNSASWIMALLQALLSVAAGVRSIRTVNDPISRAQLGWILWGAGIVMGIAVPAYILPLAFFKTPLIPHPLVMSLTSIIIVVFAIPILRYRLFDIQIVINRALVYVTLTALLVALHFLLVRLLTLVIQVVLAQYDVTMVVLVSALVVALMFNPLRQRVQSLIDRSLYRQKINYQQLLPEMAVKLATSILPEQLAHLLADELPQRLQIEWASLLALDSSTGVFAPLYGDADLVLLVDHPLIVALKKMERPLARLQPPPDLPDEVEMWLEQQSIELCIPLVSAGELVGIYNLGPKKSGQAYNSEEVRLLNQLGWQVAVGVQNGRLLQAEQRQRKLAVALAERTMGLFEETRRRAAQQEAINEIIALAVGESDLEQLLQGTLILTLRALDLQAGAISVAGCKVNHLLDVDFELAIARSAASARDGLFARIIDDWQAAPVDSMADQNDASKPVQHLLVVPVQAGGKEIGALVLRSNINEKWKEEEVALAEAVGRQLGSAFERLDLLTRTQEQARQVQQIIDTVPEGVLLLDADQSIILANPVARQQLDILAEGKLTGQVLSSLAGQRLEAFLEIRPDQPWIEVESNSSPPHTFEIAAQLLQIDIYRAGWVFVLRDVTREREIQAQIQMHERLATVGQLAAGIAHDFNNIMAAILVYADLLAMDAGIPEPARKKLIIIQDQIQRATDLIRQILDFSRRAVMEKSVLNLLPLLRIVENLLKRIIPENIHLEMACPEDEYLVEIDATRLQQVFMNLALNARDAMPEGGRLRFELDGFSLGPDDQPPYPGLSPGEWVCIRVSDTGMGIPENVLPRIFDPFYTTKSIGQGTGLGLSQVYGIIQQHGGSIDVQSQVNQGTVFLIYLPRLREKVSERAVSPTIASMTGGMETVLLVEDDSPTREALSDLLESLNYHVRDAANGREALQVYERYASTIALVVSDLVMPEMGGLQLYHALQEKAPGVKFLFITGHPLDADTQALLETGQVRWLKKPFAMQEFASNLRMILDRDSK
ncbi:MAG: response regulator [Anaerolineales bacterium]|nr:response regulator [Anaerolineales bacterium]